MRRRSSQGSRDAGKLRPQLAQPYAFQSVAQGALRLSTCTAAADAQEKAAAALEKAAAALGAAAALESETAAPAPTAAPAETPECGVCTFVRFC